MKENARITYLDGLRGIASLMVMFHHFIIAYFPAIITRNPTEVHTSQGVELAIYNSPLSILSNGNFAVQLFFILSGFSLSVLYFKNQSAKKLSKASPIVQSVACKIHDPNDTNPSYCEECAKTASDASTGKSLNFLTELTVKRYFRLVFPILFGNFIAFTVLAFHLNRNHEVAQITKSLWWLNVNWTNPVSFLEFLKQSLYDVFIVPPPFPSALNSSLWTIPYLFIGAFMVAATLALWGNLRRRYLVYALLIWFTLSTQYYPIIVGMALCDAYFNIKWLSKKSTLIGLILFVVGIYLGSFPSQYLKQNFTNTIYEFMPQFTLVNTYTFYHVVGALCILISLFKTDLLQRICNIRPAIFIGKISYSLYIIHVIVALSLGSYLFLLFYPMLGYLGAFAAMFGITAPIIIIASYLTYRFIEKKSIWIGNLFFKRIQ